MDPRSRSGAARRECGRARASIAQRLHDLGFFHLSHRIGGRGKGWKRGWNSRFMTRPRQNRCGDRAKLSSEPVRETQNSRSGAATLYSMIGKELTMTFRPL